MTGCNRVPVFRPSDWHQPTPTRWEAAAQPPDLHGQPPFEAVVDFGHDDGQWWWHLYRYDPTTETLISHGREGCGQAPTLAAARRQIEALARRWRDHPDPTAPEPSPASNGSHRC